LHISASKEQSKEINVQGVQPFETPAGVHRTVLSFGISVNIKHDLRANVEIRGFLGKETGCILTDLYYNKLGSLIFPED
jgi:hypothetical protein